MSERSNLRLLVLAVLVLSLLGTLLARAFYLQIVTGETYRAAAVENTAREVVEPSVRGLVLDQAGRPLVSNRTSVVVTVDRQELAKEDDDGAAVIRRLSNILDTPVNKIREQLLSCGTEGAKPPPICWNGSPYQPVPVASDVDTQTALTIMERRRDFPGISARLEAIREYPTPFNVNAAHILGYLGPVTEEQLQEQGDSEAFDRLRRTDVVGRSGLERTYDSDLRGKPGITTLAVDTAGNVTGTLDQQAPVPGTTSCRRSTRSSRPWSRSSSSVRSSGRSGRATGASPERRSSSRSGPDASSRWRATPRTTRPSGSAG